MKQYRRISPREFFRLVDYKSPNLDHYSKLVSNTSKCTRFKWFIIKLFGEESELTMTNGYRFKILKFKNKEYACY